MKLIWRPVIYLWRTIVAKRAALWWIWVKMNPNDEQTPYFISVLQFVHFIIQKVIFCRWDGVSPNHIPSRYRYKFKFKLVILIRSAFSCKNHFSLCQILPCRLQCLFFVVNYKDKLVIFSHGTYCHFEITCKRWITVALPKVRGVQASIFEICRYSPATVS